MYQTTLIGDDDNISTDKPPQKKNKGNNDDTNLGSCYAIMVLRQYADRVRDAILYHGKGDCDSIRGWQCISMLDNCKEKEEDIVMENNQTDEKEAQLQKGTKDFGSKSDIINQHCDDDDDVDADDSDNAPTTPKKRLQTFPPSPYPSNQKQKQQKDNRCIFIPTPYVKGVRKARTGYLLIVLQGVFFTPPRSNDNSTKGSNTESLSSVSISDLLPPIARQQISWAAKLSRRVGPPSSSSSSSIALDNSQKEEGDATNDTNNSNDKKEKESTTGASSKSPGSSSTTSAMDEIAHGIYNHLMTHYSIDIKTDKVRVDTYPKDLSAMVCKSLQYQAAKFVSNQASATATTPAAANNETITSLLSDYEKIDKNDPYSGPITLTKSATIATYVVTVIQHKGHNNNNNNNKSNTETTTCYYYWGISTKEEHWTQLNGKLNDHAASDVCIEPTDPNTGEDLIQHFTVCGDGKKKKKKKRKMYTNDKVEKETTNPPPLDAPVSRAYYKLRQVFDDDLYIPAGNNNKNHEFMEQWRKGVIAGNGLDLGAAPGGWTQVLRSRIGLSKVVSIDPGVLAQRVHRLPNIHHIMSDFTSSKSIQSIAQYAPYSWLVCDASIDSNELLPKISSTLRKATAILRSEKPPTPLEQCNEEKEDDATQERKESNNNNNNNNCKDITPQTSLLSLPAVMVITLKLPYKTVSSLERNLRHVLSKVPHELQKIASIATTTTISSLSNVEVTFRILHLMANSDSERTIVAVFEEKEEEK